MADLPAALTASQGGRPTAKSATGSGRHPRRIFAQGAERERAESSSRRGDPPGGPGSGSLARPGSRSPPAGTRWCASPRRGGRGPGGGGRGVGGVGTASEKSVGAVAGTPSLPVWHAALPSSLTRIRAALPSSLSRIRAPALPPRGGHGPGAPGDCSRPRARSALLRRRAGIPDI